MARRTTDRPQETPTYERLARLLAYHEDAAVRVRDLIRLLGRGADVDLIDALAADLETRPRPRAASRRRPVDWTAEQELMQRLIALGYKQLARELHPDVGGSRDAMTRLNAVRDRLKGVTR